MSFEIDVDKEPNSKLKLQLKSKLERTFTLQECSH